jgi:xanthine dehydrogenase accessory factor
LEAEGNVSWGVRDDFNITIADNEVNGHWLYQEAAVPPCALWIAGSGHVAQAVAPVAIQLGFEVSVFDDRPALANSQHFPAATRFRVDAWESLLRDAFPQHSTFGLIVTRGHQHDALVLKQWVQQPFAFLDMIGSQRKRRIIFEQFVSENIATEEQLARVACPVGIDIDAVSVPEIAISITAQLVQERAARLQDKLIVSVSSPEHRCLNQS